MDELTAKLEQIWGKKVNPEPFGNGHINTTFLTQEEPKLVIQQINTFVFPDYRGMMENILGVTAHLKSKGLVTIDIVPTLDGKPFAELDGEVFRAYHYIDFVKCYDSVTPEILKKSGYAIGMFQNALSDYPAETLCEVIPHFHDTPKRFADFLTAVNEDAVGRAESDLAEIAYFKAHEPFYACVTEGLQKKLIPLAVTHNDTKVNNILFREDNDEPVALIDLDTVMPGSRLYDFGDALRTGGATAAEDEEDLSLVGFDTEKYKAFAEGYLKAIGKTLTPTEISLLPESVLLLTLECGMRFLTDDLNGDKYFRIHKDRHNLIRARNQIRMAVDIEQKLTQLHRITEFAYREMLEE